MPFANSGERVEPQSLVGPGASLIHPVLLKCTLSLIPLLMPSSSNAFHFQFIAGRVQMSG